jgi:hypothetical protein
MKFTISKVILIRNRPKRLVSHGGRRREKKRKKKKKKRICQLHKG